MDKITNFMSIQNLQNLMAIFEKFMIDRYSISIQDNPNKIKIKRIIFETMSKVKQQSANQNIPIIELNKITLSIVKNVVKNKLSLDSSNSRGSSLIRDRDIHKNKNTQLHNITRPQPSNTQSMFSYDVNEQFDELSSIRANENAPPFIPDSALPSNNKLDDVMSTEDFVKELNSLEQSRDMGSITKITPTVEENNASKNTAWLSDVYKNNAEVHPKELYSAKPDIMEHFSQETTNLRNIITKHEVVSNMIRPLPPLHSPSLTPKTKTKYLIIDSRDRDLTKYTNPSEYIIDLDNIIKNIVNIEFWYAQYTKPTTSEHYINMHIREFDVDNFTKNNNFKDAFVQLPLTGGDVMTISGSDFASTKTFHTPLSKLSRLHIRFTQYNGDLFDDMTEHLLRFKVTYIQSDQVVENDLLSTTEQDKNNTNNEKYDEESVPLAANIDALEEDIQHQI